MKASQNRKKGHGIKLKKKGAGQMKEIPHEEVGCPGFLQFGKAVEDIERIPSLFLNQFMNADRKCFKQMGEFDVHNLQPLHRFQNRFMIRKTNINDIPSVAQRLFRKRTRKFPKLRKRRNPENNVVTHPNIIQGFVHRRDSAADFLKCSHNIPPFSHCSAMNDAGKLPM